MQNIYTIEDIKKLARPLIKKYKVKEMYLFGSYARGEADSNSDIDILICGGEAFKLTTIFDLSEELRAQFKKEVDVFEICEINEGSAFHNEVMKDRLLIS